MSAALRILAVDDEALLLIELVDALGDHGHDAVPATTRERALALMTNQPFDALVTDIELYGAKAGLELAHAFRKLHPAAPIVVVSGGVTPAPGDLPMGACFFPKPYGIAQILSGLQPQGGMAIAA
jgi:two-component system, response regulator PdtaR